MALSYALNMKLYLRKRDNLSHKRIIVIQTDVKLFVKIPITRGQVHKTLSTYFGAPNSKFGVPNTKIQFKFWCFKHQNWCLEYQIWSPKHQHLNTKKVAF